MSFPAVYNSTIVNEHTFLAIFGWGMPIFFGLKTLEGIEQMDEWSCRWIGRQTHLTF